MPCDSPSCLRDYEAAIIAERELRIQAEAERDLAIAEAASLRPLVSELRHKLAVATHRQAPPP